MWYKNNLTTFVIFISLQLSRHRSLHEVLLNELTSLLQDQLCEGS